MTGVVVPGRPETMTVNIASNLLNKEYHFVKFDASNEGNVIIAETAAVLSFILLTGGDGSATALTGVIALGGYAKIKLGGSVDNGDALKPTTAGEAIKADTDQDICGAIALADGVDHDIIPCKVAQFTWMQA